MQRSHFDDSRILCPACIDVSSDHRRLRLAMSKYPNLASMHNACVRALSVMIHYQNDPFDGGLLF